MGRSQSKKQQDTTLSDSIVSSLRENEYDRRFSIERSILSSIMLYDDATLFGESAAVLTSQSFAVESHRQIYALMEQSFKDGGRFSFGYLSVQKSGIPAVALVEVSAFSTLSRHAEFQKYVLVLKEMQMQEDLVHIWVKHLGEASDGYVDPFSLMESVQSDMKALIPPPSPFESENSARVALDVITHAHKDVNEKSEHFLKTGYADLDAKLGGIGKSELCLIAGRTSMGKTAFAISMAIRLLQRGIPVGFFSLEMDKGSIMMRFVSQLTGVSARSLRYTTLTENEQQQIQDNFHKIKIFENLIIDDTAGMSVPMIKARLQQWRGTINPKAIFVDYLQLVGADKTAKADNREQEVGSVSRGLKALAMEFKHPVFALVQLSRAAASDSKGSRPVLTHLRESGSLEMDADTVLFIHRMEYYGITEYPPDEGGGSTEGVAEVIVGKRRDGETGIVKLGYIKTRTEFTDLQDRGWYDSY